MFYEVIDEQSINPSNEPWSSFSVKPFAVDDIMTPKRMGIPGVYNQTQ